jgi:hypothetical protein
MSKQPSGALSKLLLELADMSELVEGLPYVLPLANKNYLKRREQTKPNALDEDQYEVHRSDDYNGDRDVLKFNVKFASLMEQSLFYSDIPDDFPTDYCGLEVRQGSPEELTDDIEGNITSAEQAGMSRDGVQSLRQLMKECKDVFRLKLGTDPTVNVKLLVIKLREGAEPVRMSARKYALPQLKFKHNKISEFEELGLVYRNIGAEWECLPLILPKPVPYQYRMPVDLRVTEA